MKKATIQNRILKDRCVICGDKDGALCYLVSKANKKMYEIAPKARIIENKPTPVICLCGECYNLPGEILPYPVNAPIVSIGGQNMRIQAYTPNQTIEYFLNQIEEIL